MCCANPPLIPIKNSHRLAPYWERAPWKIVFFFVSAPFIECFLRNNFRLRFCAVFLYLSLVHYQNVATTTMIILVPFREQKIVDPYTHEAFVFDLTRWWMAQDQRERNGKGRKEDRHKSDLFSFTENIFLKKRFVVTTKIATAQDIFVNEFLFLLRSVFPFTESREKTKTWLEMEWVSIVKIPLCLRLLSRLPLHNAARTSLREFLYNFFALCSADEKGYVCEKKETIKQFCCGSYFPIGWSLLCMVQIDIDAIYLCRLIDFALKETLEVGRTRNSMGIPCEIFAVSDWMSGDVTMS